MTLPLFEALDSGDRTAVTSTLTLAETLVVPYRAGNDALAARYETILTTSTGLRMIGLSLSILRGAARLRAAHRVRTPDALQLATALAAECSAFVTNDSGLPEMPGLRVLRLDDYLDTQASA